MCVCGPKCKGRRGLTAHQRSCAACRLLRPTSVSNAHNDTSTDESNLDSSTSQTSDNNLPPNSVPVTLIKPGWKLPKSTAAWNEANIYFHSAFASLLSIPLGDVEETVMNVQDTVYNYFAMRFGTMMDSTNYSFQTRSITQHICGWGKHLRCNWPNECSGLCDYCGGWFSARLVCAKWTTTSYK